MSHYGIPRLYHASYKSWKVSEAEGVDMLCETSEAFMTESRQYRRRITLACLGL